MSNSRPPPIRALLIDISGTLLVGSSPTPGAVQALANLRAAQIPFRLCSNTSEQSSDAVHERMRAAGLDVRREELCTSIGSLNAVLNKLAVKRPYMLLSQSALEECMGASRMGDGVGAEPDSPLSLPYDAVVVGLAPSLLDYAHLNTAFRILVSEGRSRDTPVSQTHTDPTSNSNIQEAHANPRPRPLLIALHKARYFEASNHALSLGPGPFVHALEDAAQTSAIIVGKPTRAFFELALRDLECDSNLTWPYDGDGVVPDLSDLHRDHVPGQLPPSDMNRWQGIAVIGDDVDADLGGGAVELGLWRVLVKTGKYRPGDERRTNSVLPDQVSASFADFVEELLELRKMSS